MSTGGRQLSYLPSAHIADRWLTHYNAGIVHGATIYSVADPRQVVAALPEARPTVWGAVPRIWEKIKAALEAQGVNDPSALPAEAKAGIHAKLGLDQVEWLISGAAPIPAEVLEYFLALDMPICELWGMSELSCCAVVNPPDDIRIGTVGKALPGVELKLLEDGELLVRGPIVMKGYRKQPDKTAEAVDSDGWMHTGDIADDRRRRLREDRRPQEGADHQRGGQEHEPGQHRAEDQGLKPADRAGRLHRRLRGPTTPR